MASKFREYKIVITYKNGLKQDVDLKKIDKTNRDAVIKKYKIVRDEFVGSGKIELYGINYNGSMEVQFTKEINSKNVNKDTAEDKGAGMENLNNKSTIELITMAEEIFKEIKRKNEKSPEQLSIIDKDINIEAHRIESFHNRVWNEQEATNEKIKIFDTMNELYQKRRNIKNEMNILKHINIKDLNIFAMARHEHKLKSNMNYEYLANGKEEEFQIMKRINTKKMSLKSILSMMDQMRRKFDRVFHDEETKEIVCYNKCHL